MDVDLIQIKAYKNMELIQTSDKYWKLVAPYHAEFITSDGTWKLDLKQGWITDKRSGSSIIDPIISKWNDKNYKYQAVVACHDCSYSGWVSKDLADELFVHQGFYKSGEMGSLRASMAYATVQIFGNSGYYDMNDTLPEPYTINILFEKLVLVDK